MRSNRKCKTAVYLQAGVLLYYWTKKKYVVIWKWPIARRAERNACQMLLFSMTVKSGWKDGNSPGKSTCLIDYTSGSMYYRCVQTASGLLYQVNICIDNDSCHLPNRCLFFFCTRAWLFFWEGGNKFLAGCKEKEKNQCI